MAAEWSRIVFLGPSLPLDQAKAILPDAEFRPPIKRDDLTAIPAGSIVGIIDGLLAKSLAISPGEIRDAIDHGVHAYDAASMGALRAVASTRPSPTQLVHPEHPFPADPDTTTTSLTLSMNCGSLLILKVSTKWGLSPNAFQIRPTVDFDSPLSSAIDARVMRATNAWHRRVGVPAYPQTPPRSARH